MSAQAGCTSGLQDLPSFLPVNVAGVGTASAAGLIFWSQTLAANVRLGIFKTKKNLRGR